MTREKMLERKLFVSLGLRSLLQIFLKIPQVPLSQNLCENQWEQEITHMSQLDTEHALHRSPLYDMFPPLLINPLMPTQVSIPCQLLSGPMISLKITSDFNIDAHKFCVLGTDQHLPFEYFTMASKIVQNIIRTFWALQG